MIGLGASISLVGSELKWGWQRQKKKKKIEKLAGIDQVLAFLGQLLQSLCVRVLLSCVAWPFSFVYSFSHT